MANINSDYDYWMQYGRESYQKYEKYKKIVEKCDDYIDDVKTLKASIEAFDRDLDYSKAEFENGGYVDGGQPFGFGAFSNCLSKIDETISLADTLISEIDVAKQQFIEERDYYKNCYDTAVEELKCLKAEQN